MAELKYEIVKECGVLSQSPHRLDQGTEPHQLERSRPQVRHP